MATSIHSPVATIHEGDSLSAAEFLARWEQIPDLHNIELIDQVVFFMPSPVSLHHDSAQTLVIHWLCSYRDHTPGCQAGGAATWKFDRQNVPQPDAWLRILPSHGGQSGAEGNYYAGAPELVVEVTLSTYSRDLGIKKSLYERSGVREYISVLPETQEVIWRTLANGKYIQVPIGSDGLFRSTHFPGLWLDPRALWDLSHSFTPALVAGAATAEHAAFITKLKSYANPKNVNAPSATAPALAPSSTVDG
jgi:Uma2 family endonuclease